MNHNINAHTIFAAFSDHLALEWIYGQSILSRPIEPQLQADPLYIEHYHAASSAPIRIFTAADVLAFEALAERTQLQALNDLANNDCCLLLLCEHATLPSRLLSRAKRHRLPVLYSNQTAPELINTLSQYLNKQYQQTITTHGVYLEVLNMGVLLTGSSGIGKSELALGLINLGHRLIADDAVLFTRQSSNAIIGYCPPLLKDFLEVRGLGIINIRAMFGENAVQNDKRLQLIIEIIATDDQTLLSFDRLHGVHTLKNMLGIDIPQVTIPVAPGRNLAVLVEAAVRNEILKITGYRAAEDFSNRQLKLMEAKAL